MRGAAFWGHRTTRRQPPHASRALHAQCAECLVSLVESGGQSSNKPHAVRGRARGQAGPGRPPGASPTGPDSGTGGYNRGDGGCSVWCVVCGVWCVVCGVWCVCGVWVCVGACGVRVWVPSCVVCGVLCVCGVCGVEGGGGDIGRRRIDFRVAGHDAGPPNLLRSATGARHAARRHGTRGTARARRPSLWFRAAARSSGPSRRWWWWGGRWRPSTTCPAGPCTTWGSASA